VEAVVVVKEVEEVEVEGWGMGLAAVVGV